MQEHPLPTHVVKILDTAFVTHNVKRFKVEKPKGYTYTPGQATLIALNREGWKDRRGPFTFTSLTSKRTLEFIIKLYDERQALRISWPCSQGNGTTSASLSGPLPTKDRGIFRRWLRCYTLHRHPPRDLYKEKKPEIRRSVPTDSIRHYSR